MRRSLRLTVICLVLIGATVVPAKSDSIGDFFQRIGRAFAPKSSPPPRLARKTASRRRLPEPAVPGASPTQTSQGVTAAATPLVASPTPSATPQVRRAQRNSLSAGLRDIPYAVPVPNHPGYVTSPFAPTAGWVDVHGLPSGVEVKDPFTGKIFLTP